METIIAGHPVNVNEEGYLINLGEWSKDIAESIASQANIALTPKHWLVIDYLQKEFKNNVALSIRKIGNSGVTDIKEFYALFPPAPLKLASKIAGIPKPASCI